MSRAPGRQPRFRRAVLADARAVSANRNRPLDGCGDGRVALEALRLCWRSDAFAAQVLYRAKARLVELRVPVLPRVCHRLAIALAGVCIGDPVVIRAGLHLVHGQVVIDGLVEIGHGASIAPFTTIGLRGGDLRGARIGSGVRIGSGARVIGPVEIGDGARIGANAVVVDDVPAGATAVGVPARIARSGPGSGEAGRTGAGC